MSLPILNEPARVIPPQVSAFAALVARVDRSSQARLGGESLIYQPASRPPVPVTGIFDNPFVLVAAPSAEAATETLGPSVFLRLEDLPIDPEFDEPRLVIRGIAYRVTAREPDGVGGIVLRLRQVT
jgi:hypothetical protein